MMPDRLLAFLSTRLNRTAVVVVGSLLLGFAVGSLLYAFSAARSAPSVSDADYVLMVADLYDHEKSVFNARERLAVLGKDPIDLTELAVETYSREHPEARRDIDSLRQLSTALRTAPGETTTRGLGPGLVGLLALVVASVAIAAGAAWLWKTLELRRGGLPALGVPRAGSRRFSFPGLNGNRRGVPTAALATEAPGPRAAVEEIERPRRRAQTGNVEEAERPQRRSQAYEAVDTERARRWGQTNTVEDTEGTRRRGQDGEVASPLRPDERRAARFRRSTLSSRSTALTAQRQTFEARYRLGEDGLEYDEFYPILNGAGETIGACGLSATEQSERPGRFYGFTAWLQNYQPDSDGLAAVGLVSRPGLIARSAAIAEWQRRGTIGEVRIAERGMQLTLENASIEARLIITDLDYTTPIEGSPGYFGRLGMRFEVATPDD